MKVTVCEMRDRPEFFWQDWEYLRAHVKETGSELVVLPEMAFTSWFAATPNYDAKIWEQAIFDHEAGIDRLSELGTPLVVGTRPISFVDHRFNEGFVWAKGAYLPIHEKYYLPNESGVWEASWYERGSGEFDLVDVGGARMGFLICSELWFMERARDYGQRDAHLVFTPRRTEKRSIHQWITAGTTTAMISGAFSLSSNSVTDDDEDLDFGGTGWIIDPNGNILALTSVDEPFVTVDLDLTEAERAKSTYPRNIIC